jgi:hypothetical protein
MGAYRLQYDDVVTSPDIIPAFDYEAYNSDRILTRLNSYNDHTYNGVRTETGMTDSPPVVQNKSPMGGSPLYRNTPLFIRDSIRVRVYGDDVLRYEQVVTSQQMLRLPSGYKADKWQIELTSAQNIHSFKMAGTAKELAKV